MFGSDDWPQKNLARLYFATNLQRYDESADKFVGDSDMMALIDDDPVTRWNPPVGRSYLLLTFPEAQLVSRFSIAMQEAGGRISLYTGDTVAIPEGDSWKPLLRDIELETLPQMQQDLVLDTFTRYLLIETNLNNTADWYDVSVYGEPTLDGYRFRPRPSRLASSSIHRSSGEVNRAFNLTRAYAGARAYLIAESSSAQGALNMVDEDPHTWASLVQHEDTPSLAIDLGSERTISRISAIGKDSDANGVLKIQLLSDSQFGNEEESVGPSPFRLLGKGPTSDRKGTGEADPENGGATLDVIVSKGRCFESFKPVPSRIVLLFWNPNQEGQPFDVAELAIFGDIRIETHRLERVRTGESANSTKLSQSFRIDLIPQSSPVSY